MSETTQQWSANAAPSPAGFAPAGSFSPTPQTMTLPPEALAHTPGAPATSGAVKGRRIEAMAFATFLPTFVWFLPALVIVLVVGMIVEATIGLPIVVVVLAWIAAVGVAFTKVGESLIARFVMKSRKPTGRELQVFKPAWDKVCASAGQDPEKYSLWVEDSPELNAAAGAGRVVIVTRAALALPTERFEAILAHELGHHLGGHSIPLLVNSYVQLPVALVARIPYLDMVFTGGGLVTTITNAAGRKLELNADRTAAELGFGEPLLDTLQTWLDEGQDDERKGLSLRDRMKASHPPISKRILQLENVVGQGRF